MTTPYAIVSPSTAFRKDLPPQGLRTDFYWPLTLYDIPEGGTEKDRIPTDLTDSTFTFKIYGPDGSAWITKVTPTEITITDNVVLIQFDKAAWSVTDKVFKKGCKYEYTLDWTNAAGFDREFFAGIIPFT